MVHILTTVLYNSDEQPSVDGPHESFGTHFTYTSPSTRTIFWMIWWNLNTQLNWKSIINQVIGFVHYASEHPRLETLHLIAEGAKQLDGKAHLYPYTFSYWCFPIIVCASEFQSWLYRMDLCVFLNKIVSDNEWHASHWRMLIPTNRTVITYCTRCCYNNTNI